MLLYRVLLFLIIYSYLQYYIYLLGEREYRYIDNCVLIFSLDTRLVDGYCNLYTTDILLIVLQWLGEHSSRINRGDASCRYFSNNCIIRLSKIWKYSLLAIVIKKGWFLLVLCNFYVSTSNTVFDSTVLFNSLRISGNTVQKYCMRGPCFDNK